ncbi:class I SAM-dependent methyltransferase [Ruegeria sp. 2012CJ41-6]|uniref:Class I SAM-dependent methyltransferase n=1 Tax=Ruegeria spongiae TaxID=2942209 RepID=A0ABT0Q330_9RHOB|nr:class I SAM-dependent methyltransferase [Ruegeria spongiae]MCL6284241.1 class I SAM-dependent methyltransferase [Ruegeria spongiae]
MQVTKGMVGHGFYDDNSAPQWEATAHVLPWLEEAATTLDLSGPGAITLADFGCSEGRNSVAVMQRVVAALRARSDRPIRTIHSDLPTNDFSGLFQRLNPETGRVFEADNVYSSAVGGTMFRQVLPPGSVQIAMTFNAIGFLSRRPLDSLPGYIFPNGPSALNPVGHVSAAEQSAFAQQADADLRSFALARAAELAPGGKLLIEVFGAGDRLRTCDGIYDVLNDAVLDALKAGMLTQEAYARYYQPVYMRRLEEVVAPFQDPSSELSALFSQERSELYEIPVSFVEAFKQNGNVADYAKAYTDFFRAFTETSLRLNLSDCDNLEALVHYIYTRAEQRLRETPERYPFNYIAMAVMLTRKG